MQIDDSGHISLLDVSSSDVDSLPLLTPHERQDFPLNTSNTILSGIDWGAVVAPYWYDVDTRGNGSGRIYYKDVTRGTDVDLIEEIDSLATPHLCGFTSTWALIVTWDHVGYFSERSDKVQSPRLSLCICVHTYLLAIACSVICIQHTPVWTVDMHSTFVCVAVRDISYLLQRKTARRISSMTQAWAI